MSGLNFCLVVSTIRDGRNADRMMKLVEKQFNEVMKPKGHTLSIVDPKTLDLGIVKQPFHFYRDKSQAPQVLRDLNDTIVKADAYIMLLAEYNRTLPPGLTSTLDHIPPASFNHKPSAMVSYSMSSRGGVAVTVSGLPYLTELGCLPIKNTVCVGNVHSEVSDDGQTTNEHIPSGMKKLFDELEWWAQATKDMRSKTA